MAFTDDTHGRLTKALASPSAADEIQSLIGGTTGDVYYVNSATGADVGTRTGKNMDEPFDSLDYAIGRATASNGDIIVLMPGHAETTTAIALDVAGLCIVGYGFGRNRPTLTATTASTDLINVTGANCQLHNVRLVGAASGCTALLDINGADFVGKNIRFEHGAAPLAAVTVPGPGGARFQLIDCEWYGTAAGPDYGIYIENGATTGAVSDWAVIRPRANYGNSSGLDLAFLRADRRGTGYRIENPVIIGFDALVLDINSSVAAVGDGLMFGARCVSTGAVTIANVNDVGGCAAADNMYTDAVTARGFVVPTATPD